MIEPEKITETARKLIESMIKEITFVQPMPGNVISDLYKMSETEQELKEKGYKPVSNLRLMWLKEDDKNNIS